MILYGIKNCDTVKKARHWLNKNDILYLFHDMRTHGLERETIDSWLQTLSWQELLNKRSTTWRNLDESLKNNIEKASAIELMLENPTVIKRPVLISDTICMIGFKEADYRTCFGK